MHKPHKSQTEREEFFMTNKQQLQKQKKYEQYVKSVTPTHSLPINMAKAFLTGGLICLLGQFILNTAQSMGIDQESAGSWCSLLLILSECPSDRVQPVLPNRKIRRCRQPCPYHWICKLCCSFSH